MIDNRAALPVESVAYDQYITAPYYGRFDLIEMQTVQSVPNPQIKQQNLATFRPQLAFLGFAKGVGAIVKLASQQGLRKYLKSFANAVFYFANDYALNGNSGNMNNSRQTLLPGACAYSNQAAVD